eukprot:scaffold34685_cov183-Amphora_coffeaeformis.AAC.38
MTAIASSPSIYLMLPMIRAISHRYALFLCCLHFVASVATTRDNEVQSRPPNFVILLGDNLGYADIGYLATTIDTDTTTSTAKRSRTPNIDKLAQQGLQFEHWNSIAHLCSASRSSLLTGRYPVRDGVYPGVFHENAALGLSPKTPTIASLLKEHGSYATSIVGKWHLGHRPEFLPTHHGFDEWLGIPYHMSGGSLDGHVCHRDPDERMWLPLYHNETILQQPVQLSELADRYAAQARQFIQQQAQRGEPFFLYLPFSHVHQLCAPKDLPEQEYCQWTADPSSITFDDAVEEMDWIAGQVIDALHESGVASNTLVLFTADNGPWVAEQSCSGKKGRFEGRWLMDNVPSNCTACPHDYVPSPTSSEPHRCILPESSLTLTGVPCGYDTGLGSIWEANLRMPAFAWWPETIEPGRVTGRTVSTLDILPTLLSLAEISIPDLDSIDGRDISDIILNSKEIDGVADLNAEDRILFFWRDGFSDGPLGPPYGRMDVVAVKVGHLKAWFWTKSGHYNDDPHVFHDPPLVFDVEKDPAESSPLTVSEAFLMRVKELREDHMNTIPRGPPLTLEQNDAYIPCANPTLNCRTGEKLEVKATTKELSTSL